LATGISEIQTYWVNISIGAAFHDLSIVLQNCHDAPVNRVARGERKVAGASYVYGTWTKVTHTLLFHSLFLRIE
jgi:hypothetical protein